MPTFSEDLIIQDTAGRDVIATNADAAGLAIGAKGNEGDFTIRDGAGRDAIYASAEHGGLWVGNKGIDGLFMVYDKNQVGIFQVLADRGGVYFGGKGNPGNLFVRDNAGRESIKLLGYRNDTKDAYLFVGTKGMEGNVAVRAKNGAWMLHAKGDKAVYIGDKGIDGNLIVRNNAGEHTIHLRGYRSREKDAVLYVGTKGTEGNIVVHDKNGVPVFYIKGDTAQLFLGGKGNEGDLVVRNKAGKDTIHLDGESGDIVLHNADAAEQFDVVTTKTAEPGTIMVLNKDGKLKPCSEAYDKKVVGVVAGAGDYRPGIVLDNRADSANRVPISVLGKVCCKVDATETPIEIGDLLTTSAESGHAMKAHDPAKAFGAVIGKALKPLETGIGMIPIVIALQ